MTAVVQAAYPGRSAAWNHWVYSIPCRAVQFFDAKLHVQYQRGVHLPQMGLWLDPRDRRPFAFVSHAHSDHIGNHHRVILTPGTAALMRERLAGKRQELLVPFGQTMEMPELPGTRLTLLPAGHVLGSSQIHLESDLGSLLYTGDFKLRPSLCAEKTEWLHAETLIMETTFGLPFYRFPPSEAVLGQVVAFCEEALADGAVPVLLAYSLGKAQEILCALGNAGLSAALHSSVFKMTEIYRALMPSLQANYVLHTESTPRGQVLIHPPTSVNSPLVQKITHKRTAVLTGWALNPSARFRYRTDAAFPLSDHADYDDLLRYVGLVKPRRVLTVHGYAAEFAQDLRSRGVESWALGEANQLEFSGF